MASTAKNKFLNENKFFSYYLPFILCVLLVLSAGFVYWAFYRPQEVEADVVTFSTAGSSSWTVPTGVYKVTAQVWGGGFAVFV